MDVWAWQRWRCRERLVGVAESQDLLQRCGIIRHTSETLVEVEFVKGALPQEVAVIAHDEENAAKAVGL